MTKKQWKEILERLKVFRSTNKFKNNEIYFIDTDDKHYNILKVDTSKLKLYVRNDGITYVMLHKHILNKRPSELKSRFFTTINVFEYDEKKT